MKNNLLLLLTFYASAGYMIANFSHAWWWYACFTALPIIYLFIFAHLKQNHEINEEDDTHLY
jgi:Ca2+/Na+ antiporter